MFERFTERARKVCVEAQNSARGLNHNYIGTEHILLGLLREEEGLACAVLNSLDITLPEVYMQVARITGEGEDTPTDAQIPFTPRAKKILELALREALSLGHNYIGTEHILLGLVREDEGVGAQILRGFDADADKTRNEVLRAVGLSGKLAKKELTPTERLQKERKMLKEAIECAMGDMNDRNYGAAWNELEAAMKNLPEEKDNY